jgi:hypothetical protein
MEERDGLPPFSGKFVLSPTEMTSLFDCVDYRKMAANCFGPLHLFILYPWVTTLCFYIVLQPWNEPLWTLWLNLEWWHWHFCKFMSNWNVYLNVWTNQRLILAASFVYNIPRGYPLYASIVFCRLRMEQGEGLDCDIHFRKIILL